MRVGFFLTGKTVSKDGNSLAFWIWQRGFSCNSAGSCAKNKTTLALGCLECAMAPLIHTLSSDRAEAKHGERCTKWDAANGFVGISVLGNWCVVIGLLLLQLIASRFRLHLNVQLCLRIIICLLFPASIQSLCSLQPHPESCTAYRFNGFANYHSLHLPREILVVSVCAAWNCLTHHDGRNTIRLCRFIFVNLQTQVLWTVGVTREQHTASKFANY